MIESIPVSHAMTCIEDILREKNLPRELLNDFAVSIDSETGWNHDDFDVEVRFHEGPRFSFSVYGSMGDLEEQFVNGLRTAVISLTKYVPKVPVEGLNQKAEPVEQLYFSPRRKLILTNSRFRPKAYLKPSWER